MASSPSSFPSSATAPLGDLTFTLGSNHEILRGGRLDAFGTKHRRPHKQHHHKRPRQPQSGSPRPAGVPAAGTITTTTADYGPGGPQQPQQPQQWTSPGTTNGHHHHHHHHQHQTAGPPTFTPPSSSSQQHVHYPQHQQPPPLPAHMLAAYTSPPSSYPPQQASLSHAPPAAPRVLSGSSSSFVGINAPPLTPRSLFHLIQVAQPSSNTASPQQQQQQQQQQPHFVLGPHPAILHARSFVAPAPSSQHLQQQQPPSLSSVLFGGPAPPRPSTAGAGPIHSYSSSTTTMTGANNSTTTTQVFRFAVVPPPQAGGGFQFMPASSTQAAAASSASSGTTTTVSSSNTSTWPLAHDPTAPKYRWECQVAPPAAAASTTTTGGGDDGDGETEWTAYDDHIGAQLEMAHQEGRPSLRFATRGFLYEVDLTRFTQTNTETGKTRPVRRVTEVQVDFVDPQHNSVVAWPFAEKHSGRIVLYKEPGRRFVDFSSTMERLRREGHERDMSFWEARHLACEVRGRHGDAALVRVGFGSPEYLAVQEKFALVEGVDASNGQRVMAKHAGLANSILSIFRIQNPAQMERYCLLRSSISNNLVKAGRNGTEQVLWHGPSSLQSLEGILLRGFDRAFAHSKGGANAYGRGVYLARDLTIADRYACTVYSEVDGRTCQAVILAKVLVGEYTLGSKDMYPPPMKPNSTDVYDSTVNNLENPSIFVTYQDHQATPYYIVTYSSPFQKLGT